MEVEIYRLGTPSSVLAGDSNLRVKDENLGY